MSARSWSIAQMEANTIPRSNHHVSSCCEIARGRFCCQKNFANFHKTFPSTQVNLSSRRLLYSLRVKYHKIRAMMSENLQRIGYCANCENSYDAMYKIMLFYASGQAVRFKWHLACDVEDTLRLSFAFFSGREIRHYSMLTKLSRSIITYQLPLFECQSQMSPNYSSLEPVTARNCECSKMVSGSENSKTVK